jgi:hypothetical protein
MSFRIVREVRKALRTGQIKLTGRTAALDRLVLLLIADDCHDDDRCASVGMAELSEITGMHRTTLSRSVGRLQDAGCIRIVHLGNRAPDGKGTASKYEIPEGFPCSSSATSNDPDPCSSAATPNGAIGVAVDPFDVALESFDVAVEPDRCSTQVQPFQVSTQGNYPDNYPGTPHASRAAYDAAKARATEIVDDFIPGIDRRGGSKRILVGAVADGLRGLGEERVLDLLAQWLDLPQPIAYQLRGLIDAALNGDAL